MTMAKRVAIYCRVSTRDQHSRNQTLDLRRYSKARHWNIVAECIDEGLSGTKDNRPQLKAVMDMARQRKIDILLVWRFDRFSRSVRQLTNSLDELKDLGVDFVSFSEALDTTTPTGALLYHLIAAISAFERSILIERVHAGLRRARSQGKRLGRPKAEFDINEARRLLKEGKTMTEVGSVLGVSRMTIGRKLGRIVQKPRPKLANTSVETGGQI
jgi:DNA invertase Pin-like site-specific DNA recombinase